MRRTTQALRRMPLSTTGTANCGEFVTWAAPDYRVTPLGADAVTGEPAAVRVAGTVEETERGRTLATAERRNVQEGSLYRLEAE